MQHHLLATIVLFLAAGMAGIALARLLRLSVILGFFIAGAVIGEHGLGLMPESASVDVLAELGVAFLLFDVGSHLSPRQLWASRRDLLGFGPLQIGVTTALVGGVARLLGTSWSEAMLLGAGLSLSSTAIVLQVIRGRGDADSPLGQRALSLLVFQDLFVVFLLVLLPALGGETGEAGLGAALLGALGRVALALAGVLLFARFVFKPAFGWITALQNDELFTLSALFVVLAVAFAVSLLGLSLPLGAFLAGLALSASRFAYLIQAEVAPFRALLLSLFFISVGMHLPLPLFVEQPLLLLGLSAALMASKAAAIFGAALLWRLGAGAAVNLALTLAQGSEFGFVLFAAAVEFGLLAGGHEQLVAAVIGITLAATPLVAKLGVHLGERLERARDAGASKAALPPTTGLVVIVGLEAVARSLIRILSAAGVEYLALTSDREGVACARSQGFAVEFGSPDRPRAIALLTRGDAHSVVVLSESTEISRKVIAAVRKVSPNVPLYGATDDAAFYAELDGMGLRDALMKNENTAAEIARQILASQGRSATSVEALCATPEEPAGDELLASL